MGIKIQKEVFIVQEQKERNCGTCRFLKLRKDKYDLPENYCRLNGESRYKNDMTDCMGWREQKEII